MRGKPELVAAAHANFLASFRKLAEHAAGGQVRELGGVLAFVTGFPVSLFNGCVITEQSRPDALHSALGWVREHRVAHRIWIAESLADELDAAAAEFGLERGPIPYPNMVLDPKAEASSPADDVGVIAVGRSGLEGYHDISVELGMPRELAESVFSSGFADDPDVQLFTGSLEGRPAGVSLAIRSAGVSGVYNVGVITDARRRGVGSALTWAAVGAGRAWGCEPIVLQSSEMALSMYEAMGFRTVVSYAEFREPVASGAEP